MVRSAARPIDHGRYRSPSTRPIRGAGRHNRRPSTAIPAPRRILHASSFARSSFHDSCPAVLPPASLPPGSPLKTTLPQRWERIWRPRRTPATRRAVPGLSRPPSLDIARAGGDPGGRVVKERSPAGSGAGGIRLDGDRFKTPARDGENSTLRRAGTAAFAVAKVCGTSSSRRLKFKLVPDCDPAYCDGASVLEQAGEWPSPAWTPPMVAVSART